jgi:3'-5' exonuclease
MQNFFFTDVEVVPEENPAKLTELPELFAHKHRREILELRSLQDYSYQHFYQERASLSAEFGKICSVSFGLLRADKFYVRTIADRDEVKVLQGVQKTLEEGETKANFLVGHNIIDFDCPILMRRFLINRMPVPKILNHMHTKTWELPMHDTMKMWSGTQWNHRISLDLLCQKLGLPPVKGEISGADVCDLFYGNGKFTDLPWEMEDAVKKIGVYNAGDVVATARAYARMKGFEDIRTDQVYHI